MKTPASFFFASVLAIVLSACSNLPSQHGSDVSSDALVAMRVRMDILQADVGKLTALLAKVEERTRPPKQLPKSANIPFAANPMLGVTSAKIGVVEFSDYQCPYCRTFHTAVLPELKKNYIDTGKVIFVSRDAPMDFHPMAEPAAIAANCAGEQGAYYPMQEDLYAQQNRFGNEFYQELAGKLGLDIKRFETCLHDPAQQQEVRRDSAFAAELGVEGTPTFFIGRIDGDHLVDAVPVVGAQPYGAYMQWIERLLSEQIALRPIMSP